MGYDERMIEYMQGKQAIRDKALIGKVAAHAKYQTGDRVTWVSGSGYGPYTSIVLGSEDTTMLDEVGYWCTTAPESEKKPIHLSNCYWVYPREIAMALTWGKHR